MTYHQYSAIILNDNLYEVYSTHVEMNGEALIWRNPIQFLRGEPYGPDWIPEYHALKLKSGNRVSISVISGDEYSATLRRYAEAKDREDGWIE